MKGVFTILKRFLPPYKKYGALIFIFNALTAIFSIFSFVTIIPILQILFRISSKSYYFIPWNSPDMSFTKIIQNNGYWYITHLVENYGASTTLLGLAIWLDHNDFKTGTAYFGSYFLVPIEQVLLGYSQSNKR